MAIRDEGDKDDIINNMLTHQNQIRRKEFRLDWTNYRYWTTEKTLNKPWGNYRQTLQQLWILE